MAHIVSTDGLVIRHFRTDDAMALNAGGRHDGPHGTFDLAYRIAPDHWGQGFATEAAGAFRDWRNGTRGYRAMTAGHFVDNPASGRVLRKLAFLPAGWRRYPCAGRGEAVDCIDMAWIAGDELECAP